MLLTYFWQTSFPCFNKFLVTLVLIELNNTE